MSTVSSLVNSVSSLVNSVCTPGDSEFVHLNGEHCVYSGGFRIRSSQR